MKRTKHQAIPVSPEAAAGAAVYSRFTLFFYDALVMGFENHFVWKCPTRRIIDFYNDHVSGRHLDVGVGTGYFLDRCSFPGDNPAVHLMDLNVNSLAKTSRRIGKYNPVTHHWNILEPIQSDLPKFDSICISNILHCLPGSFPEKEIALKNLKRHLNKKGTLFGLTILGKGVKTGSLYCLFNRFYNKRMIFSNLHDDREGLEAIIKANFPRYELEVAGSVALFSCTI